MLGELRIINRCSRLKIRCFFRDFSRQKKFVWLKFDQRLLLYCSYLKVLKKTCNFFIPYGGHDVCLSQNRVFQIFLRKIRTSILNLHKFINIQYLKNLIRILWDSFIIHKKQFILHEELLQVCCQPWSPAWKKIYMWNIQLFVVKKWEKYILPDRKMYVKHIFANIFRIYKENIF